MKTHRPRLMGCISGVGLEDTPWKYPNSDEPLRGTTAAMFGMARGHRGRSRSSAGTAA